MRRIMEKRSTEQYFFDTDCLSAFLWVREESILAKLYAGKIILPSQVYQELQKVPHLSARQISSKTAGTLAWKAWKPDRQSIMII